MDTLFKKSLKAYTSNAVLDDVEKNGEKALVPHNEQQYVTIVFQDLLSFTSTLEGLSAKEINDSLNSYLETTTEIIHKHNGIIVQFIGDAVFSIFGYRGEPNHEENACLAALDIVNNINSHKSFAALEKKLKVNVGVDTGSVYIGAFGSAEKLQFMVIGDHVNLASQLCNANPRYKSKILISDAVRKNLPNEFLLEKLDRVTVKGKIGDIDIYSLGGVASGKSVGAH